MTDRLTKKEKAFADLYIETGNGTQSALQVYDTESDNTASSLAYENLRKPKITAYMDKNIKVIETHMYGLATKAKKEGDQIIASKDVLDRYHGKPHQTQDTNFNIKLPKPLLYVLDNNSYKENPQLEEEN